MTELLGDGLNIGYKQALSIAESNYTINVWDGAIRSGKGGRVPDRNAPDYNPDNETKVLTPFGFKLFGDIKVGDRVVNPDGTYAHVSGVYDNGPKQFYRVTTEDGATVEADEDHLWAVKVLGKIRNHKHERPVYPEGLRPADAWNLRAMCELKVVNTRELVDLVNRARQRAADGRKMQYKVALPLPEPLPQQFAGNGSDGFSPYVLGALLGDGTIAEVGVFLTTVDDHIRQRVADELPENIRLVENITPGKAPTYRLTRKDQQGATAHEYLRQNGISVCKSNAKHIPAKVFKMTVEQRFAFAQGLMDTDGYIGEDGHLEFTTVSPELARGMQQLLRGLGCTAKISEKETTYIYNGEKKAGQRAYRLYIRSNNPERLFSLPRKVERARTPNNGRGRLMTRIVSVEKTVVDNSRCISVNHLNHLYVTDDYLVTHNTYASQLRWLGFLADPPKGGQFVMVGRTRDSLARNVLAPMQDPQIFGPYAKYVKYTHGAPLATIFDQRVHIMGASDSKAEKAIRGMTLAGAYGDEITIQSEEFFTQLLGRMNVDGAKGFFTTNPDSPAHWLKEKFLDRIGDPVNPLEDWGRWTFQLDDNPVLSEKYKARIRNEFTGLFYKRFVLGQWVSAEGAVYDMWNPARNVIRNADMPRIIRHMAIGIDYGTTNPTAAILLGLGEDDRLYAVDEWGYVPGSKAVRKTDVELSAAVKEWIGYRHDEDHPDATEAPVVVDPAAASFRVQLYQDGVPTYAAENDVLYGIRTVSGLLSADRLRINERCTGLIKEIPGYSWDPKATKQGIDAVIKENDHFCDALRYSCVTTENRWRGIVAPNT